MIHPDRRSIPWRRALVCFAAGLAAVLVSAGRWGPPPDAGLAAVGARGSVVVAARDLPATTVLSAADLALAPVDPSSAPPSAVTRQEALMGRRMLVPARRGDPLLTSMTVPQAAGRSGRRSVTLRVVATDLPAAVASGAEVDVIAALDAQAAGSGHPEERVVASATVISADQGAGAQPGPGPAPEPASGSAADPSSAPAVMVQLEVADADVLRVLWARDFARTIRLVERGPSDDLPASATGPGR